MKKVLSMIMTLVVLLSFTITAFADTSPNLTSSFDSSIKIHDKANIISDDIETTLSKNISEINSKHSYDVVIVTLNEPLSKSIQATADDIYDYSKFGVSTDDSGILFLINMDSREFAISTYEEQVTKKYFSDSNINYIYNKISDKLSSGDYDGAVKAFIDSTSNVLSGNVTRPYEVKPVNIFTLFITSLFNPTKIIFCMILGVVLIMSLKAKHTPVKKATVATNCLVSNSFKLTERVDDFIGETTSRKKINTSSNKSSGRTHTSTHKSSSGRRHGGRSGKF